MNIVLRLSMETMAGPVCLSILLSILLLARAEVDVVSKPESTLNERYLLDSTGHWSTWSSWSKCSSSCGSSERTRTRHCIGSHCIGDSTSVSVCVELTCTGYNATTTATTSVDGHWGHWSTYSACSVTCGTGHRSRHRSCNNPSPSGSGASCQGASLYTFTCRYPDCLNNNVTNVDGHWGAWSSYGHCSVSCGTGHRFRHRSCNNPPPSGSGQACSGPSFHMSTCTITSSACTAASVDGGWSYWSHWSSCSTSCDLGTITRQRTCTHPAPSHGGHTCTGDSRETHECSNGPCPTWTHWFDGDCSVSCGAGTRERLRHCSTGRDSDCSGNAYETVQCQNAICI